MQYDSSIEIFQNLQTEILDFFINVQNKQKTEVITGSNFIGEGGFWRFYLFIYFISSSHQFVFIHRLFLTKFINLLIRNPDSRLSCDCEIKNFG